MLDRLRYLLLQVRNHDDPMAGHEVECFARALGCETAHIREGEGELHAYPLSREYEVEFPIRMEPESFKWFVIE